MLLKEVRLCYILSQSEMVILNYYTIIFQYGVIISSFKYYGLALASEDQWTVAHIHVKLHLWFVHISLPLLLP